MHKKVFGKQLSRETGSRQALFRALIRAFVANGKMETTKAKAKAVQPAVERLVALSKTKDVSKVRQVSAYLANDRVTTDRMFEVIGKAFKSRNGGFTRIINLPRRLGDNAEMVRMEWTEKIELPKNAETGKKKNKKSKVVKAEIVKKEKPGFKAKVTGLLKSRKK